MKKASLWLMRWVTRCFSSSFRAIMVSMAGMASRRPERKAAAWSFVKFFRTRAIRQVIMYRAANWTE